MDPSLLWFTLPFLPLLAIWGLRRRKASRAKKSPVFLLASKVIQNAFDDPETILGQSTASLREELTSQSLLAVASVIAGRDPVMANRELLARQVIAKAKFGVLVLPSSGEDPTGLRGLPGVTGELQAHLEELADKDRDLKELASHLDHPSFADLRDSVRLKYETHVFGVRVFNATRVALGDVDPNPEKKDWLDPFLAAHSAWEEYQFRKMIGLPNILGEGVDGDLAALAYSSFMNMVMSGARHPDIEWEQKFGRSLPKLANGL